MGKKTRRPAKQETVSVTASLEVVSEENFQQRLEGMSSCKECLRERAKAREFRGKKRSRSTRVKHNSPIVVQLSDMMAVKSKLSRGSRGWDSELEAGCAPASVQDLYADLDFVASWSQTGFMDKTLCKSWKDEKNFNAFLSAIEKVHLKDRAGLVATLENLEEFVFSAKEKVKSASLLNNANALSSSVQSPHEATKKRGLELIEGTNVDLICNDLSSKGILSESSTDNSEDSESSSVISSSESQCESDFSGLQECVPEELSQEELERLTEYTTGYALTKYNCQPYECPQCLASWYHHWAAFYTQGSDFYKTDFVDCDSECSYDWHDECSCDGESGTEEVQGCDCEVTVTGKGKAEVSVGSLHGATSKASWKDTIPHDAVYVDLNSTDVTLRVYHHKDTPHSQYEDWYYNYYPHPGFQPMGLPYYPVPALYTPWPVYYNPIPKPLCLPRDLRCLSSPRLCMVPAHEVKSFTASQPPQRTWVPLAHHERNRPIAVYTVMCYNVLCDKYATRQLYGYCPSWALSWDYRKKGIMEEIRHYSSDIISLQEVETDQFYNFFLPELKRDGYDGIFSPKSRARTMSEHDRKHVDGCAIFFRTSKFSLIKEQLVEFNQVAMANAEGSDDMLNRVMTKDNIGLAALLEFKEAVWENGLPADNQIRQPVLVATCHVHWDPEFCDVKIIQTMMLMSELKNIIEESSRSFRPGSSAPDCNTIPLILCGDLNSLPDSGVLEYLLGGKISANHEEFKELGYESCLQKLSTSENKDIFSHSFKLAQGYTKDIMPFTNYTFDFKGVIDYILYSRDFMRPLGLLGPLDPDWFRENKVLGCPHPHIPSDHLPLLIEFEYQLPQTNNSASRPTHYQQARR